MPTPRTLIAFAYVADQFTRTNDIAAGLIPLFAPLITARAGKAFDPVQFAQDVKATYDLNMHPYVAEELAPSMAQHGYLDQDRRPGNVVHYTNRKIELPEPPVSEAQLQTLIDAFIEFAKPSLATAGLSTSNAILETAFLNRLVRPDFLGLVLRPDSEAVGLRTLQLPKADRTPEDERVAPRDDEHFDYLVARFILKLNEGKSSQFDLLVAATSGSLVAEVVLDLQHPPKPGESLTDAKVAIDSPLILDALGLGQDGATEYALQLLELIKRAGATPIVFDATIDEIHRVLKSTLQAFDRRQDLYGPLGRRIRGNAALATFARAILTTLSNDIAKLGVQHYAFSTVDRASKRAYFSEKLEKDLASGIGDYPTEAARLHDAQIVSDILRIRGGSKATGLRAAGIVFVTRNARLARLVRRYLTEAALSARDYFPPCITDRYLAGILWITTGGGGDSLSRLRLVSNCSAAVVPRRDVVSRLHKFLESLNPTLVERFEALMTNERAEHFLMDRTLADANLITQENYEEIYRDIELVAAERVTRKKDAEIQDIKNEHASVVQTLTEKHRDQLLGESTRAMALAAELRQSELAAEAARNDAEAAADLVIASDLRWASACLNAGKKAGRRAWLVVGIGIALVASLAAALGEDSVVARTITFCATFVAVFAASLIGNRYWPRNPLEAWIQSRRQKSCDRYAEENGVQSIVDKFEFDWSGNEVRLKRTP